MHSKVEEFYSNIAMELVIAAANKPAKEYIPVIDELYLNYDIDTRYWILKILAELNSKDGAMELTKIVESYAHKHEVPELPIYELKTNPNNAKILFPALFKYTDIEELEWSIYLIALSYFEGKHIKPEQLLPYAERVLASYNKYKKQLFSSQKESGIDWMWEEEYNYWREFAALILDIMGYLPDVNIQKELQEALNYKDPKLKCFAVLSLVRQNLAVDSNSILEVARSAEMRNVLYDILESMNKEELFPVEYKTQEAFAESNMVNWLTFPTELGRVPDEIELMKVVSKNSKDGILDYYVFRFQTLPPHWAAKDGWCAGVSGPFIRKNAPTTEPHGSTFSEFIPWDSKTPEEHVEYIINSLNKSRQKPSIFEQLTSTIKSIVEEIKKIREED